MKNKINPETVLILTPAFNDSSMAVDVLNSTGLSAIACESLDHLCALLKHECGAVIISEEAVGPQEIIFLQHELQQQEPWSDIPIILLTRNDVVRAIELFSKSGNISLLERPFSRLTLIRSVEVALRARRRQYQVRELLADLQKAKEEAERANTSKTQFLANMSHEIRTPIGAILGFADIMRNATNSPDDNKKYMAIVERNSHQLLRLIDDILDLSKVEAGKMTIEHIHFSLVEMLMDFTSIMSFKAAEKGISFRFTGSTKIPDMIITDPVRLKQILTNIVGNALKFTQNGYVSLDVAFHEEMLKFTVQDTGVGISKAQEQKLFQAFSQADTSTTRKFGGTGLGLVLSRKLSESLGGRLDLVESVEDLGSTFVIEVKVELHPQSKLISVDEMSMAKIRASTQKNTQVLKGLKILLVEDSADNQTLVTTYLNKEGAEVSCANDGAEGIQSAMAHDFDVLLMDIQMPVMDGHEAAKTLRSINYKKPLIALTAHAMKEEEVRCFESGFTAFLTKPIKRDVLIQTLLRYVPNYK